MNLEWISRKGASLMAVVIGLGFITAAIFEHKYRAFHICVAVIALIYGYKQYRKHDTPFESQERELRRKRM